MLAVATAPGGPGLGGAAKGALAARGNAPFRGAASAVSRVAAPVTDNFKLGMKAGRMDVEGSSTAVPGWAASARDTLKSRRT